MAQTVFAIVKKRSSVLEQNAPDVTLELIGLFRRSDEEDPEGPDPVLPLALHEEGFAIGTTDQGRVVKQVRREGGLVDDDRGDAHLRVGQARHAPAFVHLVVIVINDFGNWELFVAISKRALDFSVVVNL